MARVIKEMTFRIFNYRFSIDKISQQKEGNIEEGNIDRIEGLMKHNLHFPTFRDGEGKKHLHKTYGTVTCDRKRCEPVPFKFIGESRIIVDAE